MLFTFFFQPVEDLVAAVQHYRNLGWDEAWREGEHTVALQMPGVASQLMLDSTVGFGSAGPMYLVEDLGQWLGAHPDLRAGSPVPIPGGRVAEVSAPGHTYYVFAMDDVPE
ncbi:hypothetical protein [Bogoriella caseilytica]|uniref:VOC domain-containing protein n=1 Tax=Bogoriella caseilytica TaxID=56055 RepID=A0A3N2BEP5_9MICO|nr:hypothetical protein [Bogoriella caseilytica]ROR73728.1 hypothetical protein EDD31_2116 [Bogoriella caseilytica]